MQRFVSRRLIALMLVIAVVSAVSLSCSSDSSSVKSPADGITTTTRQLLIDTNPPGAPGKDQQLIRVIIPKGAVLAPHSHAGTTLSLITEGELTYTVIRDGTATLIHDAAGKDPKSEPIKAGETKVIGPGDALFEPQGMVHKAQNSGDGPIVIYQSALMDDGAPPSNPATP